MSGPIRVLHVDDDPGFADVSGTYLEREMDATVVTVTSAGEGLAHLSETAFDCVVSDYEMPGTDGIEFLEAVREDHPDLPFILFTGKGSEEVASEAISKGVTDYLQKGTDTTKYTVLANRIENAVAQYQAENRARRANQQLEAILENTTTPMFMKDADGEYLLVNDAFLELFDLQEEEVIGRTDADLFPPEMVETVRANDERVIQEGEPIEVEEEIETADGTRTYLSSKVPIYDVGARSDPDDPVAVFGVANDITARKQELAELERRYEAIFNHTYQFIGLMDPDGTLLEANEASLRFGGLDRDDVVGKPFWECYWWQVDEDTPAELRDAVERAADGEFVRYPVEVQGEDEVVTIDFSIRPVTGDDGEVEYLIPEGRDISDLETFGRPREGTDDHTVDGGTERSDGRTADRLPAETGPPDRGAGWYRTLLDHSIDIVAVIDGEGTMRYKSPAMDVHLGYDPEEIVGQNALEYVHPDDVGEVEAAITPVVEGDRYRSDPYEYRFRHADGSWRWFESVLTDATDTPLDGYVVNSRDLTERKEHEHELERQNEQLEEFASVVSHDLQTPLQVADARLQLVRETVDDEHLDEIERAHDRMRALIEDLLVLARQGERATETEPVDLAACVEQCWQHVETGAATLHVDADRTVEADQGRVKQLVENLVTNAVEHGGDDVTIRVGDLSDGFYVADDGPGIPADEREAVFERGYSTADDGTGFGLRIAERIAQAHDWDIAVVDSESGGARFEITGVEVVD